MKEQAQRIAIAEACGWKHGGDYSVPSPDLRLWFRDGHNLFHALPDYLNDLNAIQSAILSQPQEIRDKINNRLMEMLRPNDKHILDRTINATAAQRAEAFLRATGKWVDS